MGDVTFSGPLFDGRAASYSAQLSVRIEKDIAEWGEKLVKANLTSVLRAPKTPYAEEHIQVDVSTSDVAIYDDNAIYGPWLEGTGSRNSPRTRFPGYFTFRRTTQQIESGAQDHSQDAITAYIEEMNS